MTKLPLDLEHLPANTYVEIKGDEFRWITISEWKLYDKDLCDDLIKYMNLIGVEPRIKRETT